MNKYELVELMEYVADNMRNYSEIRGGGNLGTAIQGMLEYNGAIKIAESIDKLTIAIEKQHTTLTPKEEKK